MDYKKEYRENAREILKDNYEKQKMFNDLWDQQRYKEAYILVEEFIKQKNINVTERFRKADENMFWLLR